MITKIIAEELIQKAKKYVEKGDKFVIVCYRHTCFSRRRRFRCFLRIISFLEYLW